MKHYRQTANKPLRYAKISLDTRVKLVQLVIQKKQSISKASKKLGLCSSTGKLIIKKYKLEGTYFESKSSKAMRLEASQGVQNSPAVNQSISNNNNNFNDSGSDRLNQADHLIGQASMINLSAMRNYDSYQGVQLYGMMEFRHWAPSNAIYVPISNPPYYFPAFQ